MIPSRQLNYERYRLDFSLIPGPVWIDTCNHETGSYVCSYNVISYRSGAVAERKYDLYLFEQPQLGTEVCIRYGKECNEYISPGRLGDFMSSAGWHNHEYHVAQRILKECGTLAWSPRTEANP